jgi:hypothetical protein
MRILSFILVSALSATSFAGPGSLKDRKRDAFSELTAKRGITGGDAGLPLRFFNALTGKPLNGAQVQFEGKTKKTDRKGRALFAWPSNLNRREDYRKATVRHGGYISSTVEVHFMAGTIFNNRFSISPVLKPRQMRIVLDWGDNPADLDAHLVKEGQFHISYRKMRTWRERARLDRDDRDGYGPETITIDRVDGHGTYTFAVHDYSNRSNPRAANLRRAGSSVRVYADGMLAHQFIAPSGSGNAWVVFKIRKGQIVPVNQIKSPR